MSGSETTKALKEKEFIQNFTWQDVTLDSYKPLERLSLFKPLKSVIFAGGLVGEWKTHLLMTKGLGQKNEDEIRLNLHQLLLCHG